MIRAQGLSLAPPRGPVVLSGVDLTLDRGQLVAILGPNGAGKSTLLAALSGVLAPRAGQVLVDGRPLGQLSPRQRALALAVVPQRAAPNLAVDALEYVLLARYARLGWWGAYAENDVAAARRALEALDALELAHRPVHELSGGEFQRILVARALAQETPALLLDETVSGLDPARLMAVLAVLRRCAEAGRLVVAVLHDINAAALFCHRLVVVGHGRVLRQGSPAQVLTPESLREVYDAPFLIQPHPTSGAPQAFLDPGPGPVAGGVHGPG